MIALTEVLACIAGNFKIHPVNDNHAGTRQNPAFLCNKPCGFTEKQSYDYGTMLSMASSRHNSSLLES